MVTKGTRWSETKKSPVFRLGFLLLAERTGLEPATPGVTGRYSNRLNYRSAVWLAFC
jgi:hypothetical protein